MHKILVVYSHSSYFDVLDIFVKRMEKYLPNYWDKKIIFSDKNYGNRHNYECILYDDSKKYTDRLFECFDKLNQFSETPIIFFTHEDMILYEKPDVKLLNLLFDSINIIYNSFIKMVRAGNDNEKLIELDKTRKVYKFDTENSFGLSIQPMIINKYLLQRLADECKDSDIWEFEKFISKNEHYYEGCYCYNNDEKAGLFHYYSSIYPYIATAIEKGQWNLSGYFEQISEIAKEYDIDLSIRGTK